MKHKGTKLPLRNRTIAQEVKGAFQFAESFGVSSLTDTLVSGSSSDSALYRIAAAGYFEATLELGLSLYFEEHLPECQSCATRLLALSRWIVRRYGSDGCEILVRVGLLGTILKDIDDEGIGAYIIESGSKRMVIDMVHLFGGAIGTARAIEAGTFKNELG